MRVATSISSIRPSIILFGDSITEQSFGLNGRVGWGSLLAAEYARRADVFNRGFSGYNTRMALDLIPSIFPSPSPPNSSSKRGSDGSSKEAENIASDGGILFCTVYFGANDAALPGERQHVSLEEYGQNLGTIITSIRERAVSHKQKHFPIILLTPPPFDAAAWRRFKNIEPEESAGRNNEVAKTYGNKVMEVGKAHGCSVLNVWDCLEGPSLERYQEYLSDGLHLNEEGNRKVHQNLMSLIRKQHPNLAPATAAEDSPDHPNTVGVPLEGKLWHDLC